MKPNGLKLIGFKPFGSKPFGVIIASMNFEQFFPLGIAKGGAFIGRDEDASWLNRNIDAGIHSLLLAPRRYGKSSLVLHVLERKRIDFVEIDLQLCRSAKSVEKKFLHGVERIITDCISEKDKFLQTAKSFFKKAKKQWSVGLKGFFEVTIEPEHHDDIADNILTAFLFLETVLLKEEKRAVIFIDEMQEIITIEEAEELQGAIRHFAQKATAVTFVFSGSSRRLLRQMFNDTNKPLYQLCDNLVLDKIEAHYYQAYLQKAAKQTLTKNLPDDVLASILELSQRHPRRIYNLCLYFWRLITYKKNKIDKTMVERAWQKLIASEAKSIRYFLSNFNNSQLKVLAYLSLQSQTGLNSKAAQVAMSLSSTAISKALQHLENEDLIEKQMDDSYAIIDPVLQETIVQYEKELLV